MTVPRPCPGKPGHTEHGHAEHGFTLIEFVVASIPLALIGLLLLSVFGFTIAFARRGGAQVETAQQARLALHVMTQDLREASAAPGAIVIWSRKEGAALDGIGFLTARTGGPGRPFFTDINGRPDWQEAVYYLHDRRSGELRRLTGDPANLEALPSQVPARVLARDVRRFRVERQDDLITIALTVGRPPGEVVLETTIRPKN